ncbi:MAG TPA: hypothetical protein VD794_09975 [Flavisolibacter sp.]|nr:hypothetical protein [Flavisolibacter sp.]
MLKITKKNGLLKRHQNASADLSFQQDDVIFKKSRFILFTMEKANKGLTVQESDTTMFN